MTFPLLLRACGAAALAAIAAAIVAACAGGVPYGAAAVGPLASPTPTLPPSPTPSPSVSPSSSPSSSPSPNCEATIAPAATEIIAVDLSINPCTDNVYQQVIGYMASVTSVTGAVIGLTHSSTDQVQFKNIDSQPHTAANLGAWSGSYPTNGPPVTATPSPTGMDISVAGFTAGNLNPGQKSKKYVANVPGVYVFGCAYHYVSNNMRTVIIVQ